MQLQQVTKDSREVLKVTYKLLNLQGGFILNKLRDRTINLVSVNTTAINRKKDKEKSVSFVNLS